MLFLLLKIAELDPILHNLLNYFVVAAAAAVLRSHFILFYFIVCDLTFFYLAPIFFRLFVL